MLITDAQERASLAAGRCLASRGYHVTYVASARPAPAFWSRSATRRDTHLAPDPRESPEAFVDALGTILASDPHCAVLAGGDASLRAISQLRARIATRVDVALPAPAVVDACQSKPALHEAARVSGLGVPETIECRDADEALRAAADFGLPIVVKPLSSVLAQGAAMRQRSSIVVGDTETLVRFSDACGGHCLVQRRITGSVYSFFGVVADGRLLAAGLARYLRTWPPAGGNVASAVTVEVPAGLLSCVERLVATLGWDGIFELELLRDADGRFLAIDLNPRLYGSLALAVAAGAPLPALWCDRLLGTVPDELVVARPGFAYRWEDAELRHLLWQVRHGHPAAAAAVLRPRRRTTYAHVRPTDPLPLVARTLYLARPKARRRAPTTPTGPVRGVSVTAAAARQTQPDRRIEEVAS